MRLKLAAPIAIAVVSATFFAAAPLQAAKQTTTQLPRSIRPIHYDVTIVPDAQSLTFNGKVSIAIEVLQPSAAITLNAVDMTFQSVNLKTATVSATPYASPTIRLDAAEQIATFTFDKPLPIGSYRLAIDYQGKIGTQANGLFAIDYDTAAGKKRALYTQFENSDARRMIPSWDEPAHKATFTLAATVPVNQMAVSNMPIEQQTNVSGGLKQVRFGKSPKMSTYLLFFGLGDFDRATAQIDGIEVGVVTQQGSAAQAAFVLESSKAIVHEYNNYFGVPYPLPKLDNIASPGRSQFFSAMENWGAIYTFEHSILLDPSISTQRDKQGAFSIAAHEIAHQWFGDLVTMSWWDDLWLNEGFATWMAGRTTALLHPEWNTELAAVDRREAAMSRDSLATTHPVVQHVETVEQASQAFDAITYQKGSAVIRMLEGYVGADAWRTGVREYIKKHTYANTVSDDLWREIEAAAKKPIVAIAHDFTLLPGVPMIQVGEPVCAGGKTTLQLTQTEFSRDQPNKKPLTWRVPVIVAAKQPPANRSPADIATARTVVANGKATIEIPGCGTTVVNAGQSGYYRTLYAPLHFKQLKTSFAALPAIDQLGILTDTWSLGLAGHQSTADVLELVAATPLNADPKIWGNIASVFATINGYYADDLERRKTFRTFATAKLTPVLAQIGWIATSNELDTVAILRNDLIATLSALGDPGVIAEARRRYSDKDPAAVPVALRKTILGVVARHADAATWEQLQTAARNERTPLIKDQFYALLSATENEALARRALALALTAEPGATNSAGMIARVADLHPDVAFDFALANKEAVDLKVDVTSRSRYYPGLATDSADPAMIDKVNSYAKTYLAASLRRDADTAVARIAYRIKVRKDRLPELDAWLARQHQPS